MNAPHTPIGSAVRNLGQNGGLSTDLKATGGL